MADAATRTVRGRILLAVLSLCYLWVLGSLTLGPQPEGAGGIMRTVADAFSQWPVTAWITAEVLEFCANIVLFVPAGVLAACWLPPRARWAAIPVGLALSGIIESIQAIWLVERIPDVRDLVANTLGAAIGFVILRRIGPRRRIPG